MIINRIEYTNNKLIIIGSVDISNNEQLLKIGIDNQCTFVCANDHSQVAFTKDLSNTVNPDGSFRIELNMEYTAYTNDDLLFVFLYTNLSDGPYMIVVWDDSLLDSLLWDHINSVWKNNCCENMDDSFFDYVTYKKAFEYSLSTCKCHDTIKLWNLMHDTSVKTSGSCNCNG